MDEIIKLAKKYKQHPNFEEYVNGFKGYYEEVIKLLPKYKKVLDVGCAYGVLAMLMSKKGKVTACDMNDKFVSKKMLKDAGIEYFNFDLEKGHKIKDKYDLITMTETIEHLNSNPFFTIKKLYDALEDGGHLFVSTVAREIHGDTTSMNTGEKGLWNDLISWKDIPEYKGEWKDQHTFHYDQFNLITLLSEAGFKIKRVGIFGKYSNFIVGEK